MTPDTHKLLQEKFPFLTIFTYLNTEYIGIMQNSDSQFISVYLLDPSFTSDNKREFLLCGEIWWWESNRKIPINLFLRHRFKQFKNCLKTFAKKETVIIEGPVLNLMEQMNKQFKRRTIQLVKGL